MTLDLRSRRITRSSIHSEDFELPCFCAMSTSSPLAAKPSISPTDLNGLPMALLFDKRPTAKQTRDVFRQTQADLQQRFELQTSRCQY